MLGVYRARPNPSAQLPDADGNRAEQTMTAGKRRGSELEVRLGADAGASAAGGRWWGPRRDTLKKFAHPCRCRWIGVTLGVRVRSV